MATGEYEYEGIFSEDNPLPFPGATVFLFILFVVVMAVIMMNLLVGIAVDDIKEVQDHAELKKLSSQVELVLELEKVLPVFMLKRLSIQKVNLNSDGPSFWKMKDVMSKENIWDILRDREEQANTSTGLEEKLLEQIDVLKQEMQTQISQLRMELACQNVEWKSGENPARSDNCSISSIQVQIFDTKMTNY